MSDSNKTHDLVRKAYGKVAREQTSCCSPKASTCCSEDSDTQPVPEAELGLSCGDPVAFSHIQEGDVVVDLGSGGGKDVFLAAQKTGPTGLAIGVDMTPEMLALAQKNVERFRERTGLSNVEFRKGQIEDLPVKDGSVDLVISNCVVNLSPDKAHVFREVFRILKPEGRMVVSDIVLNRPLPERLRRDADLYAACIAGALLREDYLKAIKDAGFKRVEILSDHTYTASGDCCDPVSAEAGKELEGAAASITIIARKPK